MNIKSLLSLFGIAPKTLSQATEIIEPAKAALDSVSALFAAANLDLDTMLEAGPDSLKAHIDSFSADSEALDEAVAKNAELEVELKNLRVTAENSALEATNFWCAAEAAGIEISHEALADGEAVKQAFTTRATDLAQELLAQSGHAPLTEPGPAGDPIDQAAQNQAIVDTYSAMKPGPERTAFRNKHLAVLDAARKAPAE